MCSKKGPPNLVDGGSTKNFLSFVWIRRGFARDNLRARRSHYGGGMSSTWCYEFQQNAVRAGTPRPLPACSCVRSVLAYARARRLVHLNSSSVNSVCLNVCVCKRYLWGVHIRHKGCRRGG